MKKYFVVIFMVASVTGMQKQLQKAIAKSDLQKMELLLSKLKQGSPQESSYLLDTQKIDLDQLQLYAQECGQYAQHIKDTRNNVHVYTRVVLGVTTFSTGLLTAGYYFYQSVTSNPSGTYGEFLTMLAATGALMGHGIENIRMAIGNHEAHNLYAKHTAIQALIGKARQESVLDTSL